MARLRDPAGLVEDGHASTPHSGQPAARPRVGEQVEEEARVGRGEGATEAPDQGAPRARGQMERALEPGKVPRGRVLADEVGAAEELERDRPAGERVLDDVAAVHLAVREVERAHHRVDARRAAVDRAADRRQQLVRRAVVRVDEHAPEKAREARPRLRDPAQAAHELDGNRELQRRGGRKAGARVPGGARAGAEVLDEEAADAREGAGEVSRRPGERGVLEASEGGDRAGVRSRLAW